MIELYIEEKKQYHGSVRLKVLGLGGSGGNAVASILESDDMREIECLIANTDAQALNASPLSDDCKIQLGTKLTKGLGSGSNPEVGRRAAEEDLDTIIQYIEGTDILFLTCGLGGGTGSGVTPVIAQAAREMGILTVAIVTKPFTFEGKRRLQIAEQAIDALQHSVDTMIVVPNQRLLEIVDANISMLDAFALSNDILKQAIKGISDIITKSGHINVDFADVKSVMKDMGMALMGTGRACGEGRARHAAERAINSPLLENISIEGARGVLINITGNRDLRLSEISEATSLVYDLASPDANIILGSVIDPAMGDEILVTVIATGINTAPQQIIKKQTFNAAASTHVTIPQQPVRQEIKQEVALEAINGQQQKVETKAQITPSRIDAEMSENNLDTPTYLRRKATYQEMHNEQEETLVE